MNTYVQYKHHDKIVWVNPDKQGQHKRHCLCYDCARFKPKNKEDNCPIAQEIFELNIKHGIITPVWECEIMIP